MTAMLCLMFLMFLSGNGLAQQAEKETGPGPGPQASLSARFEKALLSRDLKRARALQGKLKLEGMELKLAQASVMDARKRAEAMIERAEKPGSGRLGVTALVAGISAILEYEQRSVILGFEPWEEPETEASMDREESEDEEEEVPLARPEIRQLLNRYQAVLASMEEQDKAGEHQKSLEDASWMLRTARVVSVEHGVLQLKSGEGLPVPAPLAEEMRYRFLSSSVDAECIRIYRDKNAKSILEGKLGKKDYGRLLAPPPPGAYVLELTSTSTGWVRLRKVMISDLHLTTLVLSTHVIVMAVLPDKPAAGVEIRLQAPAKDGTMRDSWGKTDANGIYMFEIDEPIRGHRASVRGRKDRHQASCDLWPVKGGYGLRRSTEIHLQCDRPIYRPGELVQGRLLAVQSRKNLDGVISQTALSRHAITLTFAPKEPWKKVIRGYTDARGVFSFSYHIPASADMGGVSCDIDLGNGKRHSDTAFEIASYRRAAILVEMQGPESAQVGAEGLAVQIQARYASGLPAASLRIQVHAELLGNEDLIDTQLDGEGKLTLPLAFHELKLTEPGTLYLEASLHSPEGKIVKASHQIRLKHPSEDAREGSARSHGSYVSIELPREKMAAGSKIPVTLRGKPDSTLLFVAVRDKVQCARSVLLDPQGQAVLDLDTKVGDWPSIELYAASAHGSYYCSSRRVRLARPEGPIGLRTKGLKKEYQPGDKVEFSVRVQDKRGKPVSATLCVAVVDERIFDATTLRRPTEIARALSPWIILPNGRAAYCAKPGDPWELLGTMMQSGATNSATGLEFDSGSLGSSGGPTPGTPATGSPGASPAPLLRKDFRPTAFWVPAASTDAQGRAIFSFILPDQMTTWRCTIIAADSKCRSLTERVSFDTRKPGAATLVLPRVFREGDQILAPLLFESGTQVGAETSGGLDCSPRPRGSDAPTALELRATKAGAARVTLEARSDGQIADRVEYSVKVLPDTLPRVRSRSFAIDKATTIQVTQPENSQQRLILYGNRASLLRNAARYLADYPHGCVEQISSKLLPLLLGKKIDRLLGETSGAALASERERRIQEGFAQLRSRLIEPSRGFRWWTENSGDLRMSALALTTLSIAKQAGIHPKGYGLILEPDKGSLRQHAKVLLAQKGRINQPPPLTKVKRTRSTRVAGLAEAEIVVACLRYQPDLALHRRAVQALVAADQDLPAGLLARAGLALHLAGDAESAKHALSRILKTENVGNDSASPFPGESAQSQAAQGLELLLRVDPENPRRAEFITRLLNLSRNGRFGETWGTACALQALLLERELGSAKPSHGKRTVEIRVDGNAQTYDLARAEKSPLVLPVNGTRIEVLPSQGTQLHIVLETTSKEAASHHKGWREPIRVTRVMRRSPRGFGDWSAQKVRAEIAKAQKEKSRQKQGGWYRESLEAIAGQATTRDVLEVEIQLESNTTLRYLSLVCPIPAGWEVIHKGDFKTLHDDEAIAGVSTLQGGRKQSYFVLLRSAMAGNVSWPPVRATCMYQPTFSGASIGNRISVIADTSTTKTAAPLPLFSLASKNLSRTEGIHSKTTDKPSEIMRRWNKLDEIARKVCFHDSIRRELSPTIDPGLKDSMRALAQALNSSVGREQDEMECLDTARILRRIEWTQEDRFWVTGAMRGSNALYLGKALGDLRTRILPAFLGKAKQWSPNIREEVAYYIHWPKELVDRNDILAAGKAAVAGKDLEGFEDFLEDIDDLQRWPELDRFLLGCCEHPNRELRKAAIKALPDALVKHLPESALRIRFRFFDRIYSSELELLAQCGDLGKKLLLHALDQGIIEYPDDWLQAMGKDILGKLDLEQLLALGDEPGVAEAMADKRFSTDALVRQLRRPAKLEKRVRLLRTLMTRRVRSLDLDDKDAFAHIFRLALASSQGDKTAATEIIARDWSRNDPDPLISLLAESLLPHYTAESYMAWETWLDDAMRRKILGRFSITELRNLASDDEFTDHALLPPEKVDMLALEILTTCLESTGTADEMLPQFARSASMKDKIQNFILERCPPARGRDLAHEFYRLTGFPLSWRDGYGTRFVAEARDRLSREQAFFLRGKQPIPDHIPEPLAPLLRQRIGLPAQPGNQRMGR